MTAEFPVAVHGLVYLLHTGRVTSSQELADNICTNPARVRKVMAKLNHGGLVTAERGQGSGYLISENGGAISLKQVLQALEEEPVSLSWRSGDIDRDCMISSGMGQIMENLYGAMNRECMQLLEHVTIASISNQIFQPKEALL